MTKAPIEAPPPPEFCTQLLTMLSTILAAFVLVAITMVLHIVGLVTLLVALVRKHAHAPTRFWPMTLLLIQVTWGLVLIHATEIGVWALFFLWAGCLPDAESAFYFSGVTYATVGYGDVDTAATMADARTRRGVNGNPDVRPVHRSLLRDHREIDRAPVQD